MIFKDYYKILGLETNKISAEEVKVAFREQAKRYHPDVIGSNSSEERFKDINEAYRVLSDHSSKRKYDRMWNTHIGKKKAKYEESNREKDSLFSDFFNMFFGGDNLRDVSQGSIDKTKKKIAVKGENIETEINVNIHEAFYGLEKKIALRTVNRKNENI